jgi:hypothetical protein
MNVEGDDALPAAVAIAPPATIATVAATRREMTVRLRIACLGLPFQFEDKQARLRNL